MRTLLGMVIPLLFGIILYAKAEPIGKTFCTLGKASWKIGTFGRTDMKVFYQESHAKIVFKIFGILLVVGAIIFACFSAYTTFVK